MPDEPDAAKPSPDVVAAAEAVMSAALGGPVRLGAGEKLPGSKRANVYRVAVLDAARDGGSAPGSVVIKYINPATQQSDDSAAAALARWTFHNDWASLSFLGALASELGIAPLAPQLYGGDLAAGLFVMQDLGVGRRLDHELLGADPDAAESALVEYAAIHGQLHGLTRGRRAEYAAIRDALGPAQDPTGDDRLDWLAPTLGEITGAVDVAPEPGAERELVALGAALRDPGPFFTFTQGDACPDNCIRVGGSLRLLDFEGGRFAHALAEGVYGRMRFPTCWCVAQMPQRVAERMEAAYRAELARWLPEADDDEIFYPAVAQSCLYWMLDWFHAFPLRAQLERDQTWRMASVRQRTMARLELATAATRQYRHLEALGATLARVRERLAARWPADTQQMAPYPAFAGRS